MTTTRTFPLLALAAALLVTVLTASPALAHTALKSSSPAEGAVLASAPTSVTLTFGEAVTLPSDPIRVTGPNGAAWMVGTATVTDATVTAPVTPAGPAGAYSVAWQVISDDGDTVKGTVHFTLTAAASPATSAAAAPSSAAATTVAPVSAPAAEPSASGGIPAWAWVLVAVVALAALAGFVVRSRRS